MKTRCLLLPLLAAIALRAAPPPPGVVIDRSPEPEVSWVGSPSIAILADGTLVASHDFFGAKSPRENSSRVFESKDRGQTWTQIAEMKGQFWSTLFVHGGALYLLGTEKEYADILIRRSDDGGHTWTTPDSPDHGRIFTGNYHCGPTPVVESNGRIWRAFEHYTGAAGTWSGKYFHSLVISAPLEADLLDSKNWQKTNEVSFEPEWIRGDRTGWLEGNVVPAPNGEIVNLLRINAQPSYSEPFPLEGGAAGIPRYEVAARISISHDGTKASFDPAKGFFQFPGSQSKFEIRFDAKSRKYWALANRITNPYSGYGPDYTPEWERNVLALVCSDDLLHWDVRTEVLRWREGLPINRRDQVAFQYPDWQFDGDDMVAVSRTAWGAVNYHNANFLTFHRINHFRSLTMADSAAPLDPSFGVAEASHKSN